MESTFGHGRGFSLGGQQGAAIRVTPADLVPFRSPEGVRRLAAGGCHRAFFALAPSFQPQLHPSYCGVACAVIVLNALHDTSWFQQQSWLDERSDAIKPRAAITGDGGVPWPTGRGLRLEELAAMLRLHPVAVETRGHGRGDHDLASFRAELQVSLARDDRFLVVNFDRAALTGKGHGHFSPLGAYDESTDSVLVMDVARHETCWYWAPVALVHAAMGTRDGLGYRGYLRIGKK